MIFINKRQKMSLRPARETFTFVLSTEAHDLIQTLMNRAMARTILETARRLTLMVSFLLAYSITSAQGWEVSFGGNKEDFGFSVIQTNDEGFLVAGYSESFGSDGDFDIYLVRTDVDGTLVWENTYDESYIEQANDMMALPDGSFLIVGSINDADGNPAGLPSHIYLLRVDARGGFMWSRRYENNGLAQSGNRIIRTADGGFAIIGTTAAVVGDNNNTDILVVKLDANTDEEWRGVYGTPYKDAGKGIVEVPGGYVFVANVKGDQSPDNDIAIYRINATGSLVSLRVYGDPVNNEEVNQLITTQDNNLVLVGSANNFNNGYILKSDFNGDTLWTRQIGMGSLDNELKAITELPDGNLVATGFTALDASTPGILLVKLTAAGDEVWERGLGLEFSDYRFGEDIIHTLDGGLMVTGYSSQSGQVFINDLTLVKVDGDGNYFTNALRGKVFWSTDGCNPLEPTDQPLANWLVEVVGEGTRYLGTTDADGNYNIPVDIGSYTVSLLPKSDAWDVCSPTSFPVDFTATYDTLVYNFPVRALNGGCAALSVNTSAGVLQACSQATYTFAYCNEGSATAEAAYIEVFLDDELTFLSASMDTSLQTTNSIIIQLGDLAPLTCGTVQMVVQVACEGVQNLQAASVSAQIYPVSYCGEIDPNWNQSSISVKGRCEGDRIVFTARNTGAAPTDGTQGFVIVEDVVLFLEAPDNGIPPLGPGEEVELPMGGGIMPSPTGATYRIIAEQVQGHPGSNYLTAAVEGCTQTGEDTYTTGIVTQFPENDQDPYIDIEVQEILLTSGVANLLLGHPKGYLDSIITTSTDLEYTVLFANTGSDTLNRLVIRDTLPETLDIASLVVGPASHPYDFEVYNGGILKITFNGLNLVPDDGGTMEAENRGYVKYSLSQKQNLPLGTVIENRTAVYFDYRAPEVTNATRHVVGCVDFFNDGCLLVNTTDAPTAEPGIQIRVVPNPFNTAAVFTIDGCVCNQVTLILRDAAGRVVRQDQYSGNTFTFERKDLAAALYFFEVRTDNQTLQSGKLLVQ